MIGQRPSIEIVSTMPVRDPAEWGLPEWWTNQVLVCIRMHNMSGMLDGQKLTAATDAYAASQLTSAAGGQAGGFTGDFSAFVTIYRPDWPDDWASPADPFAWITPEGAA